jgi:two-component system, LytTR family, sensor kinase
MRARDSRVMVQSRITRPRVIFGIATLLGCFSAFQAYQFVRFFSEKETSFAVLLGLNLGYWYAWALLAPLVLWLARTYRFERGKWVRALAVHVPAVIVITFAHAMLLGAGRVATMLFLAEREVDWWLGVRERFFLYFDWEMMTYWAIIAASHAYDFYRESQERALTTAQLQTRLAEAQLQALQRQLHPHFLFNTLNGISALMHRDVLAADRMLVRLSDLLRMALDRRSAQEVPLTNDLEFLGKYLEIEQARFGDRLAVRFDIDPETLDALVPNLLLQPLVENSVRHAVAARSEGGFVEVIARRTGDVLELKVRDNGPGLPRERALSPPRGVGLANTRSRLEHLYGASQRLQFSETPGGGLTVTVVIPFRRDIVAAGEGAAQKVVA